MKMGAMKTATIVVLSGMAGILTGCGGFDSYPGMNAGKAGRTVEFVASNADSVLLDFSARPEGELNYAQSAANQQCGIFHRNVAVLESLNTRSDGRIRATYLCKR